MENNNNDVMNEICTALARLADEMRELRQAMESCTIEPENGRKRVLVGIAGAVETMVF